MPLINSAKNAARVANVKREIDAGRPPKQAVAIAYSVQRKARKERSSSGRKVADR
jgi:hypothetical protein